MWDTEQKGWVMPPNDQMGSSMRINEAFDKVGKHPKIWELHSSDRYIFMQYTGLKDKNGQEVYECDILKSGNKIYSISYKDLLWYMGGVRQGDSEEDTFAMSSDVTYAEVIGNIYENPELLA